MNKNLKLLVNIVGNDKLSGSLRSIAGMSETASQKVGTLKKGARELDKELQGVQRQIANSTGNVTTLLNRETDLQKQIANTNRQMEKQVALLKIQAGVDKIKARGDELKSSGTAGMMGASVAAAPFFFMAKSASEYEKKLALLAQKTDMTDANTAKFGNTLLATAKSSKQTVDAMLEAADFLGGKGISEDAMKSMLPDIGKFSTAWDTSVVDSSKAAYAAFLSLKVPLSQTARSLEIMAVAGKAGGFEVKDMAKYFPQLTSSLSTFGSSGITAVADLSAALQVLEAKTGDGATAANNLDNLLGFVKSKEGIKNFQKYGINISDALKKAAAEGRSPIETIIQLLDKATKGDTSKIPMLIGDRQAGAAAVALIDEQKKYRDIKAEALSTLGMTEQEFNRMSKTSAANLVGMQSSLTSVGLALGTHLLPLLTQATDEITKIINRVGDWASANPETTKTILSVITSLIGFKFGLGAVKFAVGSLFGPFATLWGWGQRLALMGKSFSAWGGFARIMGGVGTGLSRIAIIGKAAMSLLSSGIVKGAMLFMRGASIIRTALMIVGKGFFQVGKLLLTNPMFLAIAAFAALAYLVYSNWGTIGPWLAGLWNDITGFFNSGIGNITATFLNFSPMGLLYSGFATLLKWLGFEIPSQLSTVGKNIIQGLWSGIMASKDWLLGKLRWFATLIPEPIRRALNIHSPSRVFAQIGGHVMSGLEQGLASNSDGPLSRIGDVSNDMTSAMNIGRRGASIGVAAGATPTISGKSNGQSSGLGMQSIYNITIHASTAVAQDVADQVRNAIDQIERERRGRGFADI